MRLLIVQDILHAGIYFVHIYIYILYTYIHICRRLLE